MSSYLNKYIEVKKDGIWHLVSWDALTKNGLAKKSELSHGLILRDTINWKRPGWEGLPTDITPELKDITTELDKRLIKFGWPKGYNYNHMTLTELKQILDDEVAHFVKSLRENIKKEQDNKILDGIAELKALVQGKKYRKNKKEDEEFDFYDTVDYNLDTEGYDSGTLGYIIGLSEAVNEIETLAYLYLDDEWKDTSSEDIRIIYYFD